MSAIPTWIVWTSPLWILLAVGLFVNVLHAGCPAEDDFAAPLQSADKEKP